MPKPIVEAIAVAAAIQAAPFAPPEQRDLRYTIEQVQTDAAGERRFATIRTVRFERQADGWIATVTTLSVDGTGGDRSGAMFETAMRGLVGRAVRFRLDAAGRIVGIEDRAAVIDALVSGIVASASGQRQQALASQLTAPLRAMPAEAQVSMLETMLTPILAPGAAPHPVRAASQPGRPPAAAGAPLEGTVVTVADDAGLIRTTRVSAHFAPSAATAGDARRTRETVETIDPATGLVRVREDRMTTVIGTASMTASTTTRLTGI